MGNKILGLIAVAAWNLHFSRASTSLNCEHAAANCSTTSLICVMSACAVTSSTNRNRTVVLVASCPREILACHLAPCPQAWEEAEGVMKESVKLVNRTTQTLLLKELVRKKIPLKDVSSIERDQRWNGRGRG